jgi:predicted RNA-binding Zn ribbon-like protein
MKQTPRIGKNAPLPHRVAGNLALDLANTFSLRGTSREIDHLGDLDAILIWAKGSGLIADGFRVPASKRAAFVDEVHRLRRAIDDAFAAIAHGAVPPNAALVTIRDVAARSLAAATLTSAPVAFDFTGLHRITGPLAWAALDLLRSDELARLKQCPPDDCRWLFIDRTKNGSRRWCEMATCGDRAKKNAQR